MAQNDWEIDWHNPDYLPIINERIRRLTWLRANPQELPALMEFYKDNIAQFIIDWGSTSDPRNADKGLPVTVPFILFPRQIEFIDETIWHWKNRKNMIAEKSRDAGFSWISVAVACSICITHNEINIGFGSRKEEYVDSSGDPKALFWKARKFIELLPKEFRGGFDAKTTSKHRRLSFPATGSTMTGEAGDNIGRGDRASIFFVDESAFLENPRAIDASLSATTNCRIDISTPNGMANPFAEKRFSGKYKVFTFHWRDDPRKDDEWHREMQEKLDPVTLAQEIELDYAGSVDNILIRPEWVQASVNAHIKLGIDPTGSKLGSMDVADQGKDLNCFGWKHGILVEGCQSWSGKGDDIFKSVERSFDLCDENGVKEFYYDSDGLGSGVSGDARVINENRANEGIKPINVLPYRGSAKVYDPKGQMVYERYNEDFFENYKAQAWWSLRLRFHNTYKAVVEGREYDPNEIISLSGDMPELNRIINELSQPRYDRSKTGKMLVVKNPDGMASPNHADTIVMLFHPESTSVSLWDML